MIGFPAPSVGIDVGSSRSSVVSNRTFGVVSVPSYVAYSVDKKGTRTPISYGEPARLMLGRTPPSIHVVKPLRAGAITNFGSASHLISHVLSYPKACSFGRRLAVFASVPEAATNVERRAIKQSLLAAGAGSVTLVRKPIAAAIGSGVNITCAPGSLVVDVGGGTCEISIVSLTDLIASHTIRIGGETMDHEIAAHIRRKYGIVMGDSVAEEVKLLASQLMEDLSGEDVLVKGRHCVTGMPTAVHVSSQELLFAAVPVLDRIAEAIRNVLEKAPPDIISDILQNRVLLTGGVALLHGIVHQLESRLRLSVEAMDEPAEAVARGLSTIVSDRNRYSHIYVDDE